MFAYRYFVRLLNQDDCVLENCLVFELAGMSLESVLLHSPLWPLAKSHIKHTLWQLFQAVSYLHCLGLIHTDIKPANILVDQRAFLSSGSVHVEYPSPPWGIKLIDLDDAVYGVERRMYATGTFSYQAPEVHLGLAWSRPVDVFSLGCVAVEVCSGRPLFQCGSSSLELLAVMERVIGVFPGNVSTDPWVRGFFTRSKPPRVAFDPALYSLESVSRITDAIPLEVRYTRYMLCLIYFCPC
ncbi:kinase-like domain-containing protein [Mycena leptocephala]|nr:kinase-like domain-containing protein [Mycena leptocephala]